MVTKTLLDVYLGHNPGEKVLSGSIKPGDVQQIDAAIWYSDLRGFSSISQTLSPEQVVLWMNRYFEILTLSRKHHMPDTVKGKSHPKKHPQDHPLMAHGYQGKHDKQH